MSIDRFRFRVFNALKNKYVLYWELRINEDGELLYKGVPLDSNYIVEQCTGLKDKNGNLIFEGDVFEADVLNSFDGDKLIGQKIRGIVAYYPDGACFTFAAYGPINLGNIEIIGNIHDDQFRDAAEMMRERK